MFSRKSMLLFVGLGISTFLLGLLLNAFGQDWFEKRSFGHDAYSRSLVGHHALIRWLQQSGLPTVVSRQTERLPLGENAPLLLLEPVPFASHALRQTETMTGTQNHSQGGSGETLRLLLETAQDKTAFVLLVLPKWLVTPSWQDPGWIESREPMPLADVQELLGSVLQSSQVDAQAQELLEVIRPQAPPEPAQSPLGSCEAQELGLPEAEVMLADQPQLLAFSDAIIPLASCDQGVWIGLLPVGTSRPRLIIISDPDLINNQGLGRGDHAFVLRSLLVDYLGATAAVVDETLHGNRTGGTLMAQAFSFPAGLLTLHLALTLGLLAWAAGSRFGKTSPPTRPPKGKRLLIEHTADLLFGRSDQPAALRSYLQTAMNLVGKRYLAGTWWAQRDLMSHLEQLSLIRGIPFRLRQIEQESARVKTSQDALRLALEIHTWQENMLQWRAGQASSPNEPQGRNHGSRT